MKIGIVTLGCDKNSVDAEYLAGALEARGHDVAGEGAHEGIDVLVVFTCGFIEAARGQSVGALLAYADTKQRLGNPRRLVMVGCLSQRWGEEMRPELPGVDAFAGVGDPEDLADLVEEVGGPDFAPDEEGAPGLSIIAPSPASRIVRAMPRKRLDAPWRAYVKIADGCDHTCAFCAIPLMKGPYASVPKGIVFEEARRLVKSGVREICLIAQDLAPYGKDLYGAGSPPVLSTQSIPSTSSTLSVRSAPYALPDLLSDLCRLEGDFWIRLLYLYPSGLTPRFIEVFAREDKIVKYLDVPLQHLDRGILRAMRRPDAEESILPKIDTLRRAVPDVALRTTILVGFPGETDDAFERLMEGIERIRFDWLGGFVFSPEEGTDAAAMKRQVPRKKAEKRLDRLMQTQARITAAVQARQVGRTLRVLVESVEPDGTRALARSYREASEIDGTIRVVCGGDSGSRNALAPPNLKPGDFRTVRIVGSETYDLLGELETRQTVPETTCRSSVE